MDSDTIPETPLTTLEYEQLVRNHIVAAKKVYVSDVAFVVPRFDWVSGSSYEKYNTLMNGNVTKDNIVNVTDLSAGASATILTVGTTDFTAIGATNNNIGTTFTATGSGTGTGTVTSSGPQFYVYDSVNYRVYKCINNNNGAASTVRPTSIEAYDVTYYGNMSYNGVPGDNYTWRYMYSIPKSLRNKFITGTHIPVFNAFQKRYYSDGGLGDITIIKSGANYTQSTAVITVTGDGSGAVLEPVIVNGQVGDIIVKNPGRDYTRAVLVISDSGAGAGAEAIAELNTGDLDSDQALVELLTVPGTVDTAEVLTRGSGYSTADVKVNGDGTGATAQAVIVGDEIDRIIITNKGEGYSWASLVITPQANTAINSAATTRVNVSSFLGHGRNAVAELFSDQLMFYSNITSDRLADFDVVNPYKQFGIMKNIRNLDYTSNIYDQVSPNRYQVEADFGPQVTFVGGGGIGAKGRVNVTGNFVSDIKIESVGAGYTSAPTVSFTGTGSGATAVSTIDAKLNTVTLSYGGVGYASPPGIALSAAQGSGGVITAAGSSNEVGSLVQPNGIGAVVITNQGSGYSTPPAVGFPDGVGTAATADAVVANGKVVKIIIKNPGQYSVFPSGVTFTGGGGSAAAGTFVQTFTTSSLTVSKVGAGYQQNPTLTFNGSCGISDIIVNDPGELFYTGENPSLTFAGGGGNGLAATAYVNNCVRSVIITNSGSGYYQAGALIPTTTFTSISGVKLTTATVSSATVRQKSSSGSGTGATFTITTTGSGATYTGVTTITLVSAGSGYAVGNTVTISGAALGVGGLDSVNDLTFTLATAVGALPVVTFGGSGAITAKGTAVVSGGKVAGITITDRGSDYVPLGGILSTTALTATAGTRKAALTITSASRNGTIATANFATQASAPYPLGSSITVAGLSPATFSGTFTVTACTTTSVSWADTNAAGSATLSTPTVVANITDKIVSQKTGTGTGAKFRVTITGTGTVYTGGVTTITIASAGSGYTSGTFTISGADLGGVDVTNDMSFTIGAVASAGASVSIAAPTTGTTATAKVTAGLGISHVNITNPGTGYTALPTITVASNGTRAGFQLTPVLGKATGSATVTGYLKTITLTGNGSGYTSAPTVVLSGGSPDPAAVVYSKVVGAVTSITIDEGGSGYSSRPSVIISGGEGIGASYVANINSSTGEVETCTKVKGGSNYVITKFADFTIGTLLVDELLNEYNVHSAKTNLKNNSLIITSNNGYPVVGRMKIRKKNASDYFITNTALSQKFLESRFPVACYRVRGSFSLLNYPTGTTVTMSDQTNGNKTFIVISSKDYDTGIKEMLLLPIDGGTLNNGVTLTNGTNPFSVVSFNEPALDRRTGEVLMIANNSSSFTQNSDQTLSFRTIINF